MSYLLPIINYLIPRKSLFYIIKLIALSTKSVSSEKKLKEKKQFTTINYEVTAIDQT